MKEISVNRPEPIILKKDIEQYNRRSDVQLAMKTLETGKPVLVTEFFSNGIDLLHELQTHVSRKFPKWTFQDQRNYRASFQKLSNLVLIEIEAHDLAVKKAPKIGWLEKLYPEQNNFLLPFPQVQGLNSAWQWYLNGISIPVLRNKIHPYYGVYFPTRFEHLQLFDNFLKRYSGPKKSAIDIGIGCGVLSLQMIQYGFQKVFGTDTNPNAILGFTEFMGDTKLSRKIDLDFGHLFGKWEKQTELIVFNPPWLPQSHELDRIDEAIYYPNILFPEFFGEAKKRLLPDGKLVLIFSNLAQITKLAKNHPIEMELAEGSRFKVESCFKKSVKEASEKTNRDQHWRANEEVELWVLVHK